MPYWDEWYYSNVCKEYMAAMVFAAKETGREEKAREIIQAEQERLLAADRENVRPESIKEMKVVWHESVMLHLLITEQ